MSEDERAPGGSSPDGHHSLHAPLFIDLSEIERGVRVVVAGEVDMDTCGSLAEGLASALGSHDLIEIDLSAVTFLDSQGLRVLIEAYNAAGEDERLAVVSASPQVLRTLVATSLLPILAPSLDT